MIYQNFIKYIPNSLKKRVIVLIPLLSLSGFFEVVSLALLIPLISLVLQPSNDSFVISFLGLTNSSGTEKIIVVFGIFIGVIILKGIFVYLVSKYTFTTALEIKVSFQNLLFKNYLQKDFIKHLESNSANYLRNITTECHQIEGRFIMPGLTLVAEVLPVLFIVVFLVYLNPLGVLIATVVFTISGLIITKTTSKHLKAYGKEQIQTDGMQVKIAKEAFSSLKEIALYKKEEKISNIYNSYTHKSANLISNALALGQIPKFVLEVVGLLTISLIAYISFSKGSTANEVLIELAVFMGAIVKLLPSANRIVMNLQSLTHSKPAIENIVKELESFEDNKYSQDEKHLDKLETITLRNMSFGYPKSYNFVLDNLNLTINKGEIIGLKGESGSGKSTFINLLLGLFKISDGQILINNMALDNCKNSWQSMVSYVPQEVVLFDDTLRNNIIFYQDDIQDDEIKKILQKVKMEQFADRLDMFVGEGGSGLSGGQKQRIAIARALVRNPQFIIFDEATSALDHDTEIQINHLIKDLSPEITVLIIAHKSSALKICDKIYRIKHNKLIEETNE
ncbi:ABC transporter ATP-binding protein [Aliarcobacter butzleri]|uniref:ABC transporter ATP-binding protein n=1 Tax=Aliarcobacter butzleri TaxID=28197 RepID=UPI002B24EF82|nr:ABC transporter ATP-binding protein [Aliarcobacter butzleri]